MATTTAEAQAGDCRPPVAALGIEKKKKPSSALWVVCWWCSDRAGSRARFGGSLHGRRSDDVVVLIAGVADGYFSPLKSANDAQKAGGFVYQGCRYLVGRVPCCFTTQQCPFRDTVYFQPLLSSPNSLSRPSFSSLAHALWLPLGASHHPPPGTPPPASCNHFAP